MTARSGDEVNDEDEVGVDDEDENAMSDDSIKPRLRRGARRKKETRGEGTESPTTAASESERPKPRTRKSRHGDSRARRRDPDGAKDAEGRGPADDAGVEHRRGEARAKGQKGGAKVKGQKNGAKAKGRKGSAKARGRKGGAKGRTGGAKGRTADQGGAKVRTADQGGAKGRTADQGGAKGRTADQGGAKGGRAESKGRGAKGAKAKGGRTRSNQGRTKKSPRAAGQRPHRKPGPSHWWSKRWSEALEGIQVGGRLRSGRKYARQGRVVELELEKGFATALVQGSRDAPYLVRMQFSRVPDPDWRRVLQTLGEAPAVGGGLFRGEFPPGTEETLGELGVSLFPRNPGDLKVACSCPDEANPCKHIAAVYYALGEEIDRDPFLLFRLRGLDRSELMEALVHSEAGRAALAPPLTKRTRARGESAPAQREEAGTVEDARPGSGSPAAEPLPAVPRVFWTGGGEAPSAEPGQVRVPRVSGALTQRLGGWSFWRGEQNISAVMETLYRNASRRGIAVYLGEPGAGETLRDEGSS